MGSRPSSARRDLEASMPSRITSYNVCYTKLLRARSTPRDVERALARRKRDLNDFAALISPAAEAFLVPMAEQAQALTRQRFGNGILV